MRHLFLFQVLKKFGFILSEKPSTFATYELNRFYEPNLSKVNKKGSIFRGSGWNGYDFFGRCVIYPHDD